MFNSCKEDVNTICIAGCNSTNFSPCPVSNFNVPAKYLVNLCLCALSLTSNMTKNA